MFFTTGIKLSSIVKSIGGQNRGAVRKPSSIFQASQKQLARNCNSFSTRKISAIVYLRRTGGLQVLGVGA